jgi:hypothetical protein
MSMTQYFNRHQVPMITKEQCNNLETLYGLASRGSVPRIVTGSKFIVHTSMCQLWFLSLGLIHQSLRHLTQHTVL